MDIYIYIYIYIFLERIYGYIRVDNFEFNIFMNYDYCINAITQPPS